MAENPDTVFGEADGRNHETAVRLASEELARVREQARAMAHLYTEKIGTALADVYGAELRSLEGRAATLQDLIAKEEGAASVSAPRLKAVADLDMSILWTTSPTAINQTLHAIFGQWRLVVQDKQVVGYMKAKRIANKTTI